MQNAEMDAHGVGGITHLMKPLRKTKLLSFMSNSTSVDQPLMDLELAGRGRNNLLQLDDGTHHRGDALK